MEAVNLARNSLTDAITRLEAIPEREQVALELQGVRTHPFNHCRLIYTWGYVGRSIAFNLWGRCF